MPTQLVAKTDTRNDEITVSLGSISKKGATAAEKMLASNILNALARHPMTPKITASTGSGK